MYIGKASADDEDERNFGVTYVLDFEDFNAHKNNIYEPGTCQNRRHTSFLDESGQLRPFSEWWYYSKSPGLNNEHLGSSNYLSYPPPYPSVGLWEISMKDNDNCNTVIYDGFFTWQNLRDCTNNDGSIKYTTISDDGENLNLEGVFYINVVSPYWYNSDYGYYRVYQLLSQPFIISVSKSVYVLSSTGINLMTISIISVYKQDKENTFKLIVLTETAEYLQLYREDDDFFEFFASSDNTLGAGNGNFTALTTSVTDTEGCLNNKGLSYIQCF